MLETSIPVLVVIPQVLLSAGLNLVTGPLLVAVVMPPNVLALGLVGPLGLAVELPPNA